MEYYGHIDSSTPSLTISLLPGYRGLGIGTQLLDSLLFLLRENGYLRASLSVQRKNPALGKSSFGLTSVTPGEPCSAGISGSIFTKGTKP